MALVQVTVSELNGAANKILQANDRFRDAANAVKQAADELASAWEGDAQRIFVQEHIDIDNWYKLMADAVDGYAASMTQAAKDYEMTDANAAAIINK